MLLDDDGAQLFERVLREEQLKALIAAIAPWDDGRAGARISDVRSLNPWLSRAGPVGVLAARLLGREAKPVRAILFDKNPAANWVLGWHQDRTIAVEQSEQVPGFDVWTLKDGIQHVEPPFEYVARMVTLRVHLDPVREDNAALLVSPGTHRLGRLTEAEAQAAVQRYGVATCLADAGDVWAYRTPILHASKRSESRRRRRVLQCDYSAEDLPTPLRWALAA